MHEDEPFLREHMPSLLSSKEVKAKTGNGEWALLNDEINYIHPMPRNVEFMMVLYNGSDCLKVSAKINRDTAKLSNIKVEEI